ncbi:hypothetical protein Zmor_001415 [Zophobas morio]|uniref:Uncharacterized protein n=1 Tax=Zophobas morio TaxID=2755281 RepID=A0AA38IZ30_9CUCU|nr:hypothetical protein Zmor_001415 [Zophobas morio]
MEELPVRRLGIFGQSGGTFMAITRSTWFWLFQSSPLVIFAITSGSPVMGFNRFIDDYRLFWKFGCTAGSTCRGENSRQRSVLSSNWIFFSMELRKPKDPKIPRRLTVNRYNKYHPHQ